ncbi:MAG: hypothetical protein IJI26_03275, partial [Clostridia bacterium]|nr:hypothetical protein [Clostridia bacterium]
RVAPLRCPILRAGKSPSTTHILPRQMLQLNTKLALFLCGCGASFFDHAAQFLLMMGGAVFLMMWRVFY